METVLEAFDQYESEINGLRTAAAMQENAERGYFNGSNAPYGYKAEKIPMGGDKFKRKLVPNPEEIRPTTRSCGSTSRRQERRPSHVS